MNLNLAEKWATLMEKLGPAGAFVPMVADAVAVGVNEETAAEILKRCDETDEAADALKAASTKTRAALADGKLSIAEAADLALALEKVIDEFEDIATGVDEDDAPEATTPG